MKVINHNIIENLNLEVHPEGGYFRRTYCAPVKINHHERAIGSSIYYYLEDNDFSAWHRVDCDEMWHFYSGNELVLYLIDSRGHLSSIQMGDPLNDDNTPQYLIPSGTWLAAEIKGNQGYGLVGCTCFPEFEFRGFEMPPREKLLQEFPQHKEIIIKLTRA